MRDLSRAPSLYAVNTATLGYRYPLETVIAECARRRIGWISPWRRELDVAAVPRVREALAAGGVRVASLCRSTYYTGATTRARQAAVDENRRALDLAAALGARCYVQVVGSLYPGEKDLALVRGQVRDGIAALLEHSREVGVPLALEALHPMTAGDRSCLTTLKEALDLCEELDPHGDCRLGVVVDAYHLWWDAALFDQIKRAGRRILAYHVSDWKVNTCDLVNDRGMPGEGCIDLKAIRDRVEDAGYAGPVEIEVFSAARWWQVDLTQVLDACVKSLAGCC